MKRKHLAVISVVVACILVVAGIAVLAPRLQDWQGITLQFYYQGEPVGPVYRQSWLPLSFSSNGQEVDSVVVTAYWEAVGGQTVNIILFYSEGGGPYEDINRHQTTELVGEHAFTVYLIDLFPGLSGDQQLDVDFLAQFQLFDASANKLDERTATAAILLAWEDDPVGFTAWGVTV